MVTPKARKPMKASGWRNSSPIMRATAYPARNRPESNPGRARNDGREAAANITPNSSSPSSSA